MCLSSILNHTCIDTCIPRGTVSQMLISECIYITCIIKSFPVTTQYPPFLSVSAVCVFFLYYLKQSLTDFDESEERQNDLFDKKDPMVSLQ